MNDDIVSASFMMEHLFDTTFSSTALEITNVWKKVVSKIGENRLQEDEISFGEKIANNSHVVDLKNGILLVEANHPGWIQYLKMYQKFILVGLNRALPEQKIKNLAFRVAGSNVSLSESYEKGLKIEQEKYNKKLEEDEKIINEKINKTENIKTGTLPQELLDKFESIKQSMLTNDQK